MTTEGRLEDALRGTDIYHEQGKEIWMINTANAPHSDTSKSDAIDSARERLRVGVRQDAGPDDLERELLQIADQGGLRSGAWLMYKDKTWSLEQFKMLVRGISFGALSRLDAPAWAVTIRQDSGADIVSIIFECIGRSGPPGARRSHRKQQATRPARARPL